MNKKLFIPYHIAVIVKEKGFIEECLYYFDESEYMGSSAAKWQNWNQSEKLISAPLRQQIVDWLREKHSIYLESSMAAWGNDWYYNTGDGRLTLLVTDEKDYYTSFDKALTEIFKII